MDNTVFKASRQAWNDNADMRSRRRRMKRYTYGDQWSDLCSLSDGRVVSEGEKARLNGAQPMTNNLIRQIVKSVVGRFRSMRAETEISPGLGAIYRRNQLDELDARALEEFLISGCAIQRIVNERRQGGSGVWIDNVSPDRFFVNRYNDPRGSDIELIGIVSSMSLNEVMMRFGGGDPSHESEIAAIYGRASDISLIQSIADRRDNDDSDPFSTGASSDGRCSVIEVWTLETVRMLRCHDRESARIFIAPASQAAAIDQLNSVRGATHRAPVEWKRTLSVRWRGRYFAPCGELLASTPSPWRHGGHPFAVKLYPLIDGEVHPFVEDIVDTQRHINRLITIIDQIMGVSAKGALLFPVKAKLPDMSWNDYTSRWSTPGSVIPYNVTTPGVIPTAVTASGANAGAGDLLNIELKLMEQISGVSDAMRGLQVDGLRGSATLYNAQAENSATALRDIFDTFGSFTAQRDTMLTLT